MVFEKVNLVNGGKLVFVKVILEFEMKIFQRESACGGGVGHRSSRTVGTKWYLKK